MKEDPAWIELLRLADQSDEFLGDPDWIQPIQHTAEWELHILYSSGGIPDSFFIARNNIMLPVDIEIQQKRHLI